MQTSGEFGRGGDRHVHAQITFEGIMSDAFVAFLREKARRLSLRFSLCRRPECIVVDVQGCEALVGAFEMSAILGTDDCLVENWTIRFENPLAAQTVTEFTCQNRRQ